MQLIPSLGTVLHYLLFVYPMFILLVCDYIMYSEQTWNTEKTTK